jgi:pimeloyl-ACP methyl ester carboxylesterase
VAHLGLVIPGGPFFLSAVLRIPAVALQERQVELRDVALQPGFDPSGTLEDNRDYFGGVGQQVQAVLDERAWDEVTFVAKSIGTMILGFVGPTLSLPPKVSALWLTPTFTLDFVRDGAIATGWRSLVVSGSADPWYDAERTQEVIEALDARHLLIDGAEHNLEVAGDVRTTLRALDELATAALSFMASS